MSFKGALALGDMMVVGTPPAKLTKAMAVIADTLHPAFDSNPRIKPAWSRQSCVLCSLTVRSFLSKIGFADAAVRPVFAVLRAFQDDKELHSAGIGHPENHGAQGDRWRGHMVVTTSGWLIDTTLYQVQRPAWPDLSGMVATPIMPARPDDPKAWGLPLLTGVELADDCRPGYSFVLGWFDDAANATWRQGPDARDAGRRKPAVAALVERFGRWED